MFRVLLFFNIVISNVWLMVPPVLIFGPTIFGIKRYYEEGDSTYLWITGVMSGFFLLLLGHQFLYRLFAAIHLARCGVKIQATITAVGSVYRRHLADVSYVFEFNGQVYQRSDSMRLPPYGGEITLLVDPDDPDVHVQV